MKVNHFFESFGIDRDEFLVRWAFASEDFLGQRLRSLQNQAFRVPKDIGNQHDFALFLLG
ncbi:MAG: hypothetical protein IT427_02005 [Pirellulales bacterium]|nr:hypothetical protein [Pirellulales bacterium]